ncbi:dienelactone hydrolase family protein [Shimia ponticola]|uniref:dienelactone hydrolase family protein n=1 Tax=Shimia ponticola TaxID=2582893 RepID=UPI0011BDAC50|nr:dienelactone hydrolase family protein [Shimia ponticola]
MPDRKDRLGHSQTQPFPFDRAISHEGITHSIFAKGPVDKTGHVSSARGVVLLHELPGMTPEFWRLAHWLAERFIVWCPDLYGTGQRPLAPVGGVKGAARLCISREMGALRANRSGPITTWLRHLGQVLHSEVGGPGIGVVGMCMSGGFAISMALDPWVTAPVASQPSLPLSLHRNQHGDLQLTDQERTALSASETDVMTLRFAGDRVCRNARIEAIQAVFGPARVDDHELRDKDRNPNGPMRFPHSCLTADLVDKQGSPTRGKVNDVIRFLSDRLA